MRIIPIYFFLGLCLGIYYVYITAPEPKVIIKYPTPQNAGKITYVDDSNVCYKYNTKEVPCNTDVTVNNGESKLTYDPENLKQVR